MVGHFISAAARRAARYLPPRLRRFRDDEDGGMLVFVATLAIPLILATGIAIDAGRGYLLKARLGNAIDAAGLAATMVVTDDDNFETDFEQFFNANFPSGYLDARITLDPPSVSDDQNTVVYSVSATIDTTFMRVAGFETMTVRNSTEVSRQFSSLDLALSMDMSGSMAGSRIRDARTAAESLVDILFGADSVKDHLKIGVVPWNSKVNVTDGTSYTSSTSVGVPGFTNPINGSFQNVVYKPNNSVVPLLFQPNSNWGGCVYSRYSRDGNDDNDADILLGPVTTSGGVDWHGWNHIGAHDEPSPHGYCRSSRCDSCLDHGITPLTNNRTTVENALAALTSPRGSTNIATGLAWAYRVVSPGTPFEEADPNPSGNHQRAIVLLTDGQQYGNRADAYNGQFGTGSSAGGNGLDERLRTLATRIKNQGVAIYTIQYHFDSGSLAQLMKDVATQPNAPYYHFAPDSAALDEVFDEIANHLSDLRLTH